MSQPDIQNTNSNAIKTIIPERWIQFQSDKIIQTPSTPSTTSTELSRSPAPNGSGSRKNSRARTKLSSEPLEARNRNRSNRLSKSNLNAIQPTVRDNVPDTDKNDVIDNETPSPTLRSLVAHLRLVAQGFDSLHNDGDNGDNYKHVEKRAIPRVIKSSNSKLDSLNNYHLSPNRYIIFTKNSPTFNPDIFPVYAALSSGAVNGLSNFCYALATSNNGDLYVGGTFSSCGGTPANYIAKYVTHNSSWHALNEGLNGPCHVLEFDRHGNLWVGGDFTMAGGISANRIAKYNVSTSEWSALGDNEIVNSFDYVYGVYDHRLHKSPNNGLNGTCYAIVFDVFGNVYVGGKFTTAGGIVTNNIAKWTISTSAWSELGLGDCNGVNNKCHTIVFDKYGDLWAGGQFTAAGNNPSKYISKYVVAASTWVPMVNELNGPCFSLIIDKSGDLWAGGKFTLSGTTPLNCVAKYTISTTLWSDVGGGLNALNNVTNTNCLSMSFDRLGNNLYVGGCFTLAGGNNANHIAKYTLSNSTWSPLEDENKIGLNNMCRALIFDRFGNLWVGGDFNMAGGKSANYVTKWTTDYVNLLCQTESICTITSYNTQIACITDKHSGYVWSLNQNAFY